MVIENHYIWKVGELAKLTGITVRTLRYYDQIDLLSPSCYSDSGHRIYDETDISRLQQILLLKDLGLSLDQVKSILDDDNYNPEEVVSLQIDRLKDNIRVQQKLLKELQNVSHLLQRDKPFTIKDFTQLFSMMKKNHEKYFSERKSQMGHHFDRLGGYLVKKKNDPNNKEEL